MKQIKVFCCTYNPVEIIGEPWINTNTQIVVSVYHIEESPSEENFKFSSTDIKKILLCNNKHIVYNVYKINVEIVVILPNNLETNKILDPNNDIII